MTANKIQILKPFGPSIAIIKIPANLVEKLNNYIEKIVENNDSIPSMLELLLSAEIYLPVLGFIFLIFIALMIKKIFYSS